MKFIFTTKLLVAMATKVFLLSHYNVLNINLLFSKMQVTEEYIQIISKLTK
jgi:hypothetical protein